MRKFDAGIAAAALMMVLVVPPLGCAQSAAFGVCIGAPLNRLVSAESGMVAGTGRYTFGPLLELGLPGSLSVDVGPLYKQLSFGLASGPARLTAHRLELPLLLRYRIRGSQLDTLIHARMSFDRVVAVSGPKVCETRASLGLYCINGKAAVQLRHRHTHGFVLGGSIGLRLGGVRLAPELLVTRWVDRNFGTWDSALRSNLTQIDLSLALKF